MKSARSMLAVFMATTSFKVSGKPRRIAERVSSYAPKIAAVKRGARGRLDPSPSS
jgi:hypothetical protein